MPSDNLRSKWDGGDLVIYSLDGSELYRYEYDGTLQFSNDAVCWEDLRVPAVSTRLGGTKDPDFALFKNDGEGSPSQGVFTYWFDNSTEEELYFAAQLPHAWNGTDILAHVHWTPAVNGGAGQTVCWGLEYTWASIGGDFGNLIAWTRIVREVVEGYA